MQRPQSFKLHHSPNLQVPSNSPYRQFSIVEILDCAVKVWVRHIISFILLSVITVAIPELIFRLFADVDHQQFPSYLDYILGYRFDLLTLAFIIFLQVMIIWIPCTYITSEHLFGNRVNIFRALWDIKAKFVVYLASAIRFAIRMALVILATAVVGGVIMLVMGALTRLTSPSLATPLSFIILASVNLGVSVLVYGMIVMFFFLPQFITLENGSTLTLMRRAWWFGSNHFWMNLALLLLFILLIAIANLVILNIYNVVSDIPSLKYTYTPWWAVVITTVFVPLIPIAFTLRYYDVRTRDEQIDAYASTSRPHEIVPKTPIRDEFVISSNDFINIAILSVLMFISGASFAMILLVIFYLFDL